MEKVAVLSDDVLDAHVLKAEHPPDEDVEMLQEAVAN